MIGPLCSASNRGVLALVEVVPLKLGPRLKKVLLAVMGLAYSGISGLPPVPLYLTVAASVGYVLNPFKSLVDTYTSLVRVH